MPNMEKVIKGLHDAEISLRGFANHFPPLRSECHEQADACVGAIALLKEQEELIRKLQKDKDKLCLEVSEWKHKFHDAPPKFVSQGVVDQIRWERDTALSQLEQIGKGLGSKMDDIVALLKEQERKKGSWDYGTQCSVCKGTIIPPKDRKVRVNFCPWCGADMRDSYEQEGR